MATPLSVYPVGQEEQREEEEGGSGQSYSLFGMTWTVKSVLNVPSWAAAQVCVFLFWTVVVCAESDNETVHANTHTL